MDNPQPPEEKPPIPYADLEYRHQKLRLAVEAMRDKQRTYYRTRAKDVLKDALALEARVDQLLTER